MSNAILSVAAAADQLVDNSLPFVNGEVSFDDVFESVRAASGFLAPMTLEFVQPLNYVGETTPTIQNQICDHKSFEKVTIHEGGSCARQTTGECKTWDFSWVRACILAGVYNYGDAPVPEHHQRASSLGIQLDTSSQEHEVEVFQHLFRHMLRNPEYDITQGNNIRFDRKQHCTLAHAGDARVAFWYSTAMNLPAINDDSYGCSLFIIQEATDPFMDFADPDVEKMEYRVATYLARNCSTYSKGAITELIDLVVDAGRSRKLVVELTKKLPQAVAESGTRVLVPRLGSFGILEKGAEPVMTATFPVISVHPTYERDLQRLALMAKNAKRETLKGGTNAPVFSFLKPRS